MDDDGNLRRSEGVLARLERLHPRVIDLSLDRVLRLLTDLGNPQDRLAPVVHVAGTNGKGSVVAFLRAILQAHGYHVHVFTSPHLIRFHERIVVAGNEIDEHALVDVLEACEAINAGRPITFFEITTAAAFLAFARTAADVTLLETGLGGRLDATNVVARPALTALTPIAMDHQAFLGESLAEIAGEKAGILKPGVPCVSVQQPSPAAAVIRHRAETVHAPVAWEGANWRVDPGSNGFVYESTVRSLRLPLPGLAGQFQFGNAGLSVACAEALLGAALDGEAVAHGLLGVRWPGRLQRLGTGRLSAVLPPQWDLWLDGGHNPAAASALASEIQTWRNRPTDLVVGMLRNKDAAGFLGRLGPYVRRIVAVPIPGAGAGFTADELAHVGSTIGLTVEVAVNVENALALLTAAGSRAPSRVLICGSLYLAGAVLSFDSSGGDGTRARGV